MQSNGLALSLLAIVACHTAAAAMFNRCSKGDACVDIRSCDRFGPYHTEPSKWSARLKEDFRGRLCQRDSINGVNVSIN
ncbi:AGAP009214-PA-like protein [Anopheles sinensis]|uniref:AGAP009214-PA-like protein n=1 Tax=Anopheles sinensis TaxID=74873 RepID=A0A084WQL8_ANOSI|nr:AGAP009214-PA-like protein [Anopheles sinensis]